MDVITVTLGGVEYPLKAKYTIKDVIELVPLLSEASVRVGMAQMQAQAVVVHRGLVKGGYSGDFQKDFLVLEGVGPAELMRVQMLIGRMIGYYAPEPEKGADQPGEGGGAPLAAASP